MHDNILTSHSIFHDLVVSFSSPSFIDTISFLLHHPSPKGFQTIRVASHTEHTQRSYF